VTKAKRGCSILVAVALGLATIATPSRAALAAGPSSKKTLWEKVKGGHDLLDTVPQALVFDGGWSFAVHVATELTNRSWDAPYPWGTVAQYSTRLIYGTGWTVMLALESLAVVSAANGTFDWLGEATYRTDWMIATDAPVCPRPGAYGGCGVGVGDFAYFMLRPRKSHWWFEAGGGWIQQRIYNDQFRTVAESSWVLTPLTALYELSTDREAPVALRVFAGPGIFFGLHNGHMHPTLRGEREKKLDPPFIELYPLDGGIGPGGRAEARLIFGRRVALEGELIMAPFLLGGPTGSRPSTDIAPLDFEREGTTVWRKLTAGIAYDDPKNLPFKMTFAIFGAELSDRPVGLAGHRGGMIRFDFPLRVPGGSSGDLDR
jgi:hypothetical protein